MAVAVHVYIFEKNGAFSGVEHVFYGRTEAEADRIRLAHMAGCENYGKAEATDRVVEDVEDIEDEDIPSGDDFISDDKKEPEAEPDQEEDEEEG
jgi:hypothetical protein